MAPSGFVDKEYSTKVSTTAPPTSIPDDIFQAGLAASQYDSDGEDPFRPQAKRFMQTEHQKEQQKRALEIRRVAWTIRKIRYQRQNRFRKLPPELVLKLMQHTHLDDLFDLIDSSDLNQTIFHVHKMAIFRGIEIEQFPGWKWLFGDSKHRTPAQSQHLKDAIFSKNHSPDPRRLGWAHDEQLVKILRMIDNNEFTGLRNVTFLQDMENLIDKDMQVTESYTKMKIARRTAMCLRSLTFQRPEIVNKEDWTGFRSQVTINTPSWEIRSQLINEQPVSIQAEMRSIFKIVIEELYHRFEPMLLEWERRHYRIPNTRRNPQELKKWMSKLVTGLILQEVILRWRADFGWWYSESINDLAYALAELLDAHDGGVVGVIEEVKKGVDFGKSIGLELESLLEGTLAGDFLMSSV